MPRYTTTQTSTHSTIDMYWRMVNNRYRDIHNKVDFAYDKDWADGAITDAQYGIRHRDLTLKYKDNILISRYKAQFIHIIKQLHIIKAGLSK